MLDQVLSALRTALCKCTALCTEAALSSLWISYGHLEHMIAGTQCLLNIYNVGEQTVLCVHTLRIKTGSSISGSRDS